MSDIPKMKKGINVNKRKTILNVVFLLVITIGLGVMFYPNVSNFFYKITADSVITNYNSEIDRVSESKKEAYIKEAEDYNSNTKYDVKDIFETDNTSKDAAYDKILNFQNDGLMGYIEIPVIGVKLPIYHGTSDDVLNKGVGHLKGTSLPVGGSSTHAVLAAHRGLPSAKLFTDLNLVKKGDIFYINVVNRVLTYKIDSIEIVEPHELNMLQISEGKDYITLVTCTPYAVNSHRLLVRGVRIENLKESEKDKIIKRIDYLPLVLVLITMGITAVGVVSVNIYYNKKKQLLTK